MHGHTGNPRSHMSVAGEKIVSLTMAGGTESDLFHSTVHKPSALTRLARASVVEIRHDGKCQEMRVVLAGRRQISQAGVKAELLLLTDKIMG